MLVEFDDLASRLPVTLAVDEAARVVVLLGDAEEIVRDAFSRVGRDFDAEVAATPWLAHAAKRVIRDMVAAAVLIGGNVGQASVSSTTGAESDSVTYGSSVDGLVGFGRLILTDAHREELGLLYQAGARGSFPRASRWPERWYR
jgi:DNA-directed RNA polymerase specialized sigma24 family protein